LAALPQYPRYCTRSSVGAIEIRAAERRLVVNDQDVTIGARAFDVLLTLIANRERVVAKDELLNLVWPNLVVEENNLQVQVSTLRKLLGANAVATIPGRGYRFTLTLDDDANATQTSANQPANAERHNHPKHNLPEAITSFVGREREIAELKDLLATTRLVTLTSMGGTGKTRLSLEIGFALTEQFKDGVWFVEFAPLNDARLVPQAVAAVLGVKEDAGRPVTDALEKFVKDRELLLILDNCEHLVDAAAGLAKALLRAGRGVQVLASSRERLHVMGETAYVVPSLSLPTLTLDASDGREGVVSPSHVTTYASSHLSALATGAFESFQQYDAIRLFADRAAAAKPRFQLTRENASAIADICRRLDGIPLAIELAAARVYTMSVEQIATRLSDRFGLLTGGDKTAMLRQQTLRASIDWSVDLLSQAERDVLHQLSVFAGGWTLEAAESVCKVDNPQDTSIVDILIQLVEKSLLMMDADGERYRMLETVRQYAREQLNKSGDATAARTRHLQTYLAFAETARPELAGAQQGQWLAKLDTERENFLAAHAHASQIEQGGELGLRLVWALKPYWFTRGQLALGLQIAVEALAHPQAGTRNLAWCQGLFCAGQISMFMGAYPDSKIYLEESRNIAREIGDKRREAITLQPLGMVYLGSGDKAMARVYLSDALLLAIELADRRQISTACNALAQLERMDGDLGKAESLYEQSLSLLRELGDRKNIAISLLNISMVAIEREAFERAKNILFEALSISAEIASRRIGQSVLDVAAGLAAALEDWTSAMIFFGAAESQATLTGLQRDPTDEAFLAPRIALTRNCLGERDALLMELKGRALAYDQAMETAHNWLKTNAGAVVTCGDAV
jgi:predicted ATPase/DNA-binding winged helix-turn-helix (wHTH) protein